MDKKNALSNQLPKLLNYAGFFTPSLVFEMSVKKDKSNEHCIC